LRWRRRGGLLLLLLLRRLLLLLLLWLWLRWHALRLIWRLVP